jgi:MoaA/NifB/PqqE/SkfB family radical SAM enzyme
MSLGQSLSLGRTLLGILHGQRLFGGPLLANLNLTNRCNVRCIHCYFYSPFLERPNLMAVRRARQDGGELPEAATMRRAQNLDMPTEMLRTLLDELVALGTRRFQLSGRGEVCLHPQWLEAVARLKHARGHCIVQTNGTLLTPTACDELVRVGCDDVRITLMAGSRDGYQRTHPGIPAHTFAALTANLEYLCQRKRETGRQRPQIALAYVVVAQNAADIVGFADYAVRLGVDRVLFRPVDDIGDPALAQVVPDEAQSDTIRRQLTEAQAILEAGQVGHNIAAFRRVFRSRLDTSALYRHIPCYYGWLGTHIYPEGEVYACCRCYQPLGNVGAVPFRQIWHSDGYRQLRSAARRLPERQVPPPGCSCDSCVHHTANTRVYRALHPWRRWQEPT